MDDRQQRQVARGLRQGDTEAWQTLYDAYCKQVWRWVARQMGPTSAGEVADVVQEVFLAAARSARSYDATRGSLRMWLAGIARRHVALYHRKEKRYRRVTEIGARSDAARDGVIRWLDSREVAPAEALARTELSALVRATLTELSTDYETLLTAKYFDGATVEEIAGWEDCSATAVRSKLARARRAFRRAFAKSSTRGEDGDAR